MSKNGTTRWWIPLLLGAVAYLAFPGGDYTLGGGASTAPGAGPTPPPPDGGPPPPDGRAPYYPPPDGGPPTWPDGNGYPNGDQPANGDQDDGNGNQVFDGNGEHDGNGDQYNGNGDRRDGDRYDGGPRRYPPFGRASAQFRGIYCKPSLNDDEFNRGLERYRALVDEGHRAALAYLAAYDRYGAARGAFLAVRATAGDHALREARGGYDRSLQDLAASWEEYHRLSREFAKAQREHEDAVAARRVACFEEGGPVTAEPEEE